MIKQMLAVAALTAAAGAEPPCLDYDPTLGTTPEEQGWLISLLEPAVIDVSGGVLHQSTLPAAVIDCVDGSSEPQNLSWRLTDVDFELSEGVVFEAEVQIIASQFNANPCEDWPRPGFGFGLRDAAGHRVWVGLGDAEIFLANEAFEPFGHPGIVTTAFDTTDAVHAYRLEIDGPSTVLFIDDAPILSLAGYGAFEAGAPVVFIGDPTTWANSAADIYGFRVHPLGMPDCADCPADFNGDGAVNILDFVAFQTAFVNQDPDADCDGNGVFNILDFVCFQTLFAAGC